LQISLALYYLLGKNVEKKASPAGNRTPVSRVTGGDTDDYTTEDLYVGSIVVKTLEVFIKINSRELKM
jgi:hypothetical protein